MSFRLEFYRLSTYRNLTAVLPLQLSDPTTNSSVLHILRLHHSSLSDWSRSSSRFQSQIVRGNIGGVPSTNGWCFHGSQYHFLSPLYGRSGHSPLLDRCTDIYGRATGYRRTGEVLSVQTIFSQWHQRNASYNILATRGILNFKRCFLIRSCDYHPP